MSSPSNPNALTPTTGREHTSMPVTTANRARSPWMAGIATLVAFAMLGAISCGCSREPSADWRTPSELTFSTNDGVELKATLRRAHDPAPPGLILVHGQGADRHAWTAFAEAAQREGMMSIAIDMRGHGDSPEQAGETLSYREFDSEDWMKVVEDIRSAKQALLDNGAAPDNLAILGADIGGSIALHYATRDPQLQALVMISPGLEYEGVGIASAFKNYTERPCLLVSSKGDSYSASSAQQLQKEAPAFCELREYAGATHGTDILASSASATGQILLWLKTIVGPKQAPEPPAE